MNKFVKGIVGFSIKNRYFILLMTAIAVIVGVYSYANTPIEAFPDVTNTQIRIISQWPGASAEEIEKFVTIPIETEMSGVMKKIYVRSISMFGLSRVTVGFADDVDDAWARQQVIARVHNAKLPDGVEPDIEPPSGPTGEIFRYTVQGPKSITELKTLEEWVVERQFRSVQGVADVVSFGGKTKTYEISVDPHMLAKYDITAYELYEAVQKSNINVGGDVIEKNGQAYVVRGIGLLKDTSQIENIVVKNLNGVPILVKNVAKVYESFLPRLGKVGLDYQNDVVEGIVLLRKGENPSDVIKELKQKVEELNTSILPEGVKIVTFYNRENLINFCTRTVLHNLLEGIVLVTVIVFIFMADWRTTVIVALIIPLALLFAFTCLRLKGMTANLLSMGAIDFGIIIDGAVVMVEGVFVTLDHLAHRHGMEKFNKLAKGGVIKNRAGELGKSIFFSKVIIIFALIPIFAFEKVEGKMFSPLAYTLGFALLGALIFTLTLVPALMSFLLRKDVREKDNKFAQFITSGVLKIFSFTYRFKFWAIGFAFLFVGAVVFSSKFLGTEFLPHLDEGALWVESQLPISVSLTDAAKFADEMRSILLTFPEVRSVMSQTGRPDDGTDPSGFFNVQCNVDLYPKEEWKRGITKDQLVDSMDAKLKNFPGIVYNYSQPILDNVEEAVSGVNGALAVKIYGPDQIQLDNYAHIVHDQLATIQGIDDLGILKNLGQPEFRIELDQQKMSLYGINVADCNAMIGMAIGGKAANQMYEGEKKFDIRIRYQPNFRQTSEEIGNLLVPAKEGSKIPIKEFATIRTLTGPAYVFRDGSVRYIAVKFSIRDRDLGSAIAEGQRKVNKALKLPKGYSIVWAGEFENQQRASKRLTQVVPLSLLAIFLILFIIFRSLKDAGIVLLNVPFAIIGGILAIHITGINFSISAGIGFIALFGICIQNGVILIGEFKSNLGLNQSLKDSIFNGVSSRVRPVVMTALMAALGLLPAAISTGIGSETQKPLAIVVIGGLITSTILTLLVLPLIFEWVYRRHGHTYHDPEVEEQKH